MLFLSCQIEVLGQLRKITSSQDKYLFCTVLHPPLCNSCRKSSCLPTSVYKQDTNNVFLFKYNMILVHPGVNHYKDSILRRILPPSINLESDIKDVCNCEQLCKAVELSSEPKLND